MSSVPVFVGLDYHQDAVQVCVLNWEGRVLCNRSTANDATQIEQLAARHGSPRRVAIEACCGAADLAEELASERGLPVQLAHPGYVNRMKRSPDKTDLGDAQLLADLARAAADPRVTTVDAASSPTRLSPQRCQVACPRVAAGKSTEILRGATLD